MIYVICCIYAIIEWSTNYKATSESIESVYRADEVILFIIVISLMLAINLFALLVILNLLIFHLWLYIKNMTTFEYIMRKREKEIELEKKIEELKEQIKKEEENLRKEILNSIQSSISNKDSKPSLLISNKPKSLLKRVDENSKNLLVGNISKPRNDIHDWIKDNNTLQIDNSSEEKDHNDNDMDLRITATSMFKNYNISLSNANEHLHNCENEYSENNTNYFWVKKQNLLENISKNIGNDKFTTLQIIEDSAESKELSQHGYGSFNSQRKQAIGIK